MYYPIQNLNSANYDYGKINIGSVIMCLLIIYSTAISVVLILKQPIKIIKEVEVEVEMKEEEEEKELVKEDVKEIVKEEEELLLANYNAKETALALQTAYDESAKLAFEKWKETYLKDRQLDLKQELADKAAAAEKATHRVMETLSNARRATLIAREWATASNEILASETRAREVVVGEAEARVVAARVEARAMMSRALNSNALSGDDLVSARTSAVNVEKELLQSLQELERARTHMNDFKVCNSRYKAVRELARLEADEAHALMEVERVVSENTTALEDPVFEMTDWVARRVARRVAIRMEIKKIKKMKKMKKHKKKQMKESQEEDEEEEEDD